VERGPHADAGNRGLGRSKLHPRWAHYSAKSACPRPVFSCGQGISDTAGAALWSLDSGLEAAHAGAAGIHFHQVLSRDGNANYNGGARFLPGQGPFLPVRPPDVP
jgi:hypothetical protein